MEDRAQARPWRTPEELVEIGFSRARVVMMNEAHSGDERCVRTREIGRRILSAVHGRGVQHLAMEARIVPFVEEENRTRQSPEVPADYGYLAQPDMKALMQAALDLGWTLVLFLTYETIITGSEKPISSAICSRSTRASLVSSATETAASRLRRYTAEAYTSSRE